MPSCASIFLLITISTALPACGSFDMHIDTHPSVVSNCLQQPQLDDLFTMHLVLDEKPSVLYHAINMERITMEATDRSGNDIPLTKDYNEQDEALYYKLSTDSNIDGCELFYTVRGNGIAEKHHRPINLSQTTKNPYKISLKIHPEYKVVIRTIPTQKASEHREQALSIARNIINMKIDSEAKIIPIVQSVSQSSNNRIGVIYWDIVRISAGDECSKRCLERPHGNNPYMLAAQIESAAVLEESNRAQLATLLDNSVAKCIIRMPQKSATFPKGLQKSDWVNFAATIDSTSNCGASAKETLVAALMIRDHLKSLGKTGDSEHDEYPPDSENDKS